MDIIRSRGTFSPPCQPPVNLAPGGRKSGASIFVLPERGTTLTLFATSQSCFAFRFGRTVQPSIRLSCPTSEGIVCFRGARYTLRPYPRLAFTCTFSPGYSGDFDASTLLCSDCDRGAWTLRRATPREIAWFIILCVAAAGYPDVLGNPWVSSSTGNCWREIHPRKGKSIYLFVPDIHVDFSQGLTY